MHLMGFAETVEALYSGHLTADGAWDVRLVSLLGLLFLAIVSLGKGEQQCAMRLLSMSVLTLPLSLLQLVWVG